MQRILHIYIAWGIKSMNILKQIFNSFKSSKEYHHIVGAFCALLLVLGLSTSSYLNQLSQLENENMELISTNQDLEDEISQSENDYKELKNDYDQLDTKYNNLSDDNDSLKAELENYKDQQATIDDQNAKLVELQSQYDSLEKERDSLQAQVDAKKAAEEQAAREAEQARLAQQESSSYGSIVYWVAGGEVYHSTPNCATLKRSKNIQSGTIAQSGKGRPCKVCY